MAKMVRLFEDELKRLVVERLMEAGLPQTSADIVAKVLVFADLRKTHSHGVLRVEHYINRIRQGGINISPKLKVKKIKPSVGLLDAKGSIGHVSAHLTTEKALSMAKKHGIAAIGIQNGSHCGALAYYINMILEEKLAGIMMGNTDAAVVPFGGKQSFFGTNPFAFGFPGRDDSILMDMATSDVSFGKILYARENNTEIPADWAVDKEGNPTTNPHAASALFPFGGHKGYGINLMVEAFSGVLIGGVFGPHVKPMYAELESFRNLSSFILVINPTLFIGESIYDTAQSMIEELRSQPPAPGYKKVFFPGENAARNMSQSKKEGIEIPETVHRFLSNEKE